MILSSQYLYFSSLVLVFIFLFIINKIENFNYLAVTFCPPHFYHLSQSMIVTLNENFNNQLWKYEENFLQLFTFCNYIESLSRLLCTGLFFHFLSHLPLSFSLSLSPCLFLSLLPHFISLFVVLSLSILPLTPSFPHFPFSVLHRSDMRVAIWTTTPWTIPANLAVAVNRFFSLPLYRIAPSSCCLGL